MVCPSYFLLHLVLCKIPLGLESETSDSLEAMFYLKLNG